MLQEGRRSRTEGGAQAGGAEGRGSEEEASQDEVVAIFAAFMAEKPRSARDARAGRAKNGVQRRWLSRAAPIGRLGCIGGGLGVGGEL